MKLLNYIENGHIRTAIRTENGAADILHNAAKYSMNMPHTMEKIIAGGSGAIEKLRVLEQQKLEYLKERDIRYASCIASPEKILCVGLNYHAHTAEANEAVPKEPLLFGKFNNALNVHQSGIPIPAHATQIDYEAELVIVIGKEAYDLTPQEAGDVIFGYTCGNDVSARDLQFIGSQWLIGKSCDGFAPVGPHIVTADELQPNGLAIELRVNGEVRQSSNTNLMIFDCATIVSYASRCMRLKAGDLIFTGTPSGVIMGYPEDKRVWLKTGDEVAVTIEGIGTLANYFQ